MAGGHDELGQNGDDASRSALVFVHRLLCQPAAMSAGLDGLLVELIAAFAGSGGGFAVLPSGKILARRPTSDEPLPWNEEPELAGRALRSSSALTLPRPDGGSLLLTGVRLPCRLDVLLWLTAENGRDPWSAAEAAALTLAGQALGRLVQPGKPAPRWAVQLEHAERQQGLETAARVTARLAHDFGNVLTGVVGFGELCLALKAPVDSQMSRYLRELQQCAQNGAQLTHMLRLFSRRQAGGVHPCQPAAVIAEEAARLGGPGGPFTVHAALANGLPSAAIDASQLRQVLAVLVENARDAMQGAGAVTVSSRKVDLTADDCLELYGDVNPGPYIELAVADCGPGLSDEAARRLFTEPFFTTRPRRRGFGLAIAYGILHAHHGGLRLRPGQPGGTVAEIYLPIAGPALPGSVRVSAGAQTARGEKVLVVDDDPNILRFICATLERAGYQAQGALSAEEALSCYTAAAPNRFHLVLSDVLMPKVSGVDLARRLLSFDADVRVLFMSGQTSSEFTRQDFARHRFEFLSKPFRPEGLLRAVRGAIDRTPPRGAAPPPGASAVRPSVSI